MEKKAFYFAMDVNQRFGTRTKPRSFLCKGGRFQYLSNLKSSRHLLEKNQHQLKFPELALHHKQTSLCVMKATGEVSMKSLNLGSFTNAPNKSKPLTPFGPSSAARFRHLTYKLNPKSRYCMISNLYTQYQSNWERAASPFHIIWQLVHSIYMIRHNVC